MTTLRPFALALAAAALLAARPAAAGCDGPVDFQPGPAGYAPAAHAPAGYAPAAHAPTGYAPAALAGRAGPWHVPAAPPPAARLAAWTVVLPPLPGWLAVVAAPPPPVRAWTPRALAIHHRWLDGARASFYARWGASPWRVARFEAWHRAYRAGLDRQWTLVARADPAGWRGDRHGRGHDRHGD